MVVEVRSLDLAVGIDNAQHARPPYSITLAACVVGAQPVTGRCCIEPSGSVTRALTPGNEASSVAPRSGGLTYRAVESASATVALAAKTETAM